MGRVVFSSRRDPAGGRHHRTRAFQQSHQWPTEKIAVHTVGSGTMSKYLIVTRGGRGIGAEISRKATKQGYSVCVNFYRDQTTAQKLVHELEKEGTNAQAY